MDDNLISIITDLGKENGSRFFFNRFIFKNLISNNIDNNNSEHRLLLKIANAGYISSIAKCYNSNDEKERIINALYDYESIDKIIAGDFVNTLSNIVDIAMKAEKQKNENCKKLSEEKAKQEFAKEKQLLEDFLYKSLVNIIKYKGIEILSDYNYCRAYLKDMANGDYIEQITTFSLLLKNEIHYLILKKRFIKLNKTNLLEKVIIEYRKLFVLEDNDTLLVGILINAIEVTLLSRIIGYF
jgi:hypothetical protein